jgi:hypothetical protein
MTAHDTTTTDGEKRTDDDRVVGHTDTLTTDTGERWRYDTTGDVDVRHPVVSCRVEGDSELEIFPPSADGVTLGYSVRGDDGDDVAGALVELTAAQAEALGRDLIATAAGAREEARGE